LIFKFVERLYIGSMVLGASQPGLHKVLVYTGYILSANTLIFK
jgi:hypothetical protein